MVKKSINILTIVGLLLSCIIVFGCAPNSIEDNSTYYSLSNSAYIAFEDVNYTGYSVQVYVKIKNESSSQISFNTSAFTLKHIGSTKTISALSAMEELNSGSFVDRFPTFSIPANTTTKFKIVFNGAGENLSDSYNFNYLGSTLVTVHSGYIG